MTSEDAFTELVAATAALRHARQDLACHRALAKHGMANSLRFCESREYVAFHRWERANAVYANLQPAPASKPITAPKLPTAVAAAKIAPKPTATVAPKPATAPVTPKPTAQPQASSAFLDYLVDQCGGQLSPLDPRFRRGR